MSGDSGDSSSDFSEKPSTSRRITRRSNKNAASTSASSSSNFGGSGNKRKRRIVMRIEFDDDSDESSSSFSEDGQEINNTKTINSDDENNIKPCSSRKLRGKIGKKSDFVFNSDDSTDDDMPVGGYRSRRSRRNNQKLEDYDEDGGAAEEGGSSSSNGREIVRPVRKAKKAIVSDEEDAKPTTATSQQINADDNGFNSDSSSNELLEKCPICLLSFRAQEIGSPATCEHIFCANCIEAWSKNVQTCPIDRIKFDKIIVRESYENRELVREIIVSNDCAQKLDHSDDDVTHCEVCNRPDREDVMLLCDSCNQGYHIDCLSPPLSEVPEGSWYCDNCFDSENDEESDLAEDLNELYADIRDMGIPETRLRVTEVHQPRILRTRQNERIRAAILSRTQTNARRRLVDPAPSTSRTGSTTRASTSLASTTSAGRAVRNSSRTTSRVPKTRRRRRRRARQRTYVVEYDLNNFDEKFAIKTTKKVIRRKRRKRRTRKSKHARRVEELLGERITASKRLAEQMGVKRTDRDVRSAEASQTFSLFGDANDLEYFSDSDNGGLQSEIQIETGGGTAMQTSVRISNFRTHRSKKALLSRAEREPPSSTPDLLSNIMNLQDRWLNASRHLDAVRIRQDGSLDLPTASAAIENPTIDTRATEAPTATATQPSGVSSNEITQAPMYPRGGGGNNRNFNSGGGGGAGGGNSGGGNYNNRYNNQSNYRGSGGSGNSGGGQYRNSFGSSGSSGGSGLTGNLFNMVGRGNFSFSTQNTNQNNDNNNQNNNNQDRFNQRNNNNNNNRNQRNSLPNFNYNNNQTNDNLISVNQSPLQQHRQQNNRQIIPIQSSQNLAETQQFPIQTQPPLMQTQPPSMQTQPPSMQTQPPPMHTQPPPMQPAPIQSLLSMPIQPPPGLYNNLPPVSAPPPMFGPPNMPPPTALLSQPPPNLPMHHQQSSVSAIPSLMGTTMSAPPLIAPPLAAPPAFNSSLFQLTADYGADEDDDSNCPNFSVYSMESLQVANSDVKAAEESKGESPKEDDENEDLVQLSDDDETNANVDEQIPLPPNEPIKSIANEVEQQSCDLYEPDQPTIESDDESEDNNENNKNKNESFDEMESQPSPENNMELESQDAPIEYGPKPFEEINETESGAVEEGSNANKDDEIVSLSEIKLPEEQPTVRTAAQRKGVLELYDDDDWEELNMERPKVDDYQIKTPPLVQNQEIDQEIDENEEEAELQNEEETSINTPPPVRMRPDSADAEAANGEEKENEDGEKEQDRSYTPCLDEKNDDIEEDIDEDGARTPELTAPIAVAAGLINSFTEEAHTPERVPHEEASGIGGMETELISEDDDGEKRDKSKRSKGDKKDKETFKKVSKNQKVRNYRSEKLPSTADKFKERRRRSRSRTNDKENQGMSHRRAQRGRFKRREIPRYNVRNVVNQQRTFKDRYGRDTSRPRSLSKTRRRRSFSGSGSRSKSRSRSRSRSLSSPPKRARRSFSISPSPPRYPPARRQSMSPRRRSRSPINRSPIRRQSRTPLRMRSRSNTPVRRLTKHKNKRPKRPITSPIRRRSLSRFTPRLSRSRTPPRHKNKRPKERKKKKNKKRQASPSPMRTSRHRDSLPPTKRKRHRTPNRSPPPMDQGWSPSPSPQRNYVHDNISWTPPIVSSAGVSRLRRNDAYNEFSIPSKPPKEKKKRDKKKKKAEKRRTEIGRKEKRRRGVTDTAAAPSKEVFASGNNILVSVSFNKDGNQPKQTTVVTLPPTREEVLASIRGRSKEPQNDQQNKKKKRKDGRKRKKLDTKPVAIIDLERSPFQVTQEQADVIVLTDSENGGNEDNEHLNVSRESASAMMTEMDHHHQREGSSHRTVNSDKTPPLERLETIMEESYENAIQQQGPKTPPEPPGGIKFNLINKNKQKNIRNVLHDEVELESDEHHEEERQEDRDLMSQGTNKIGPNTPPESGPCSPDVYDPFDPTKSPSMSPRSPTPPPVMSHESVHDNDKHSTEDLRSEPRQPVQSGPIPGDKGTLNPVDLVMALINTKANASQDLTNKSNDSQYNQNQSVVNLIDDNDKPEEPTSNLGITVLSNVILPNVKTQHIPSISSPPLSKASSQLHKPPQKLTNILSGLPLLNNRHNGGTFEDAINDIESPYSPGSADYEDLFDPPPDTNGNKRRRDKRGKKGGDIFENLFGSSPQFRSSTARKQKAAQAAARKSKTIVKVTKLPDDHVKVYDDLPNSAVELQVKDKFLRKLNRQERVVEEVKMILKPRFNKKQITKDDYKEIMRRAVPKICHSRSGEINPKKIKNLIEAYVKKFRQKHKKLNIPNTGQVSSAVKCAAYLKKL